MVPTDTQLAERMFNAYNAQGPNPGKTWDGKDVPAWAALNDQVRGKWVAAAVEAMKGWATRELCEQLVQERTEALAVIGAAWEALPERKGEPGTLAEAIRRALNAHNCNDHRGGSCREWDESLERRKT